MDPLKLFDETDNFLASLAGDTLVFVSSSVHHLVHQIGGKVGQFFQERAVDEADSWCALVFRLERSIADADDVNISLT